MDAEGHPNEGSGSPSSRQSSPSSSQLPSSSGQRSGGNASRASGRSRPRASLACMNCRQRKIKCNFPSSASAPGPGASCASCRTLQIPCILSRDGDRRKAGSREQVATLQDRVQFLESLIARDRANGRNASLDSQVLEEGQRPLNASSDVSVPSQAFSDLGNSDMALAGATAPSTWSAHGRDPLLINSPPIDGQSQRSDGIVPRAQRTPNFALNDGSIPQGQPIGRSHATVNSNNLLQQSDRDTTYASPSSPAIARMQPPDIAPLTPSSEKDRSRLDLDENYGRPRFYGPTSQLYIKRRSTADAREAQNESNDLTSLNLDSAPLRAQLFHTYWRIQPNSVVVVDETLFEAGRATMARTEYYSTFLENALLSCATRMSTSEGVRALGSRYAARAKLEIAQELEYSNIATLQGFLLMSDFEATRGRDRLGYMYCGIACRLIFDLGLPESCDGLVSEGKLSTAEAIFRHTLLLGAFVYDKLWSMYLGRPGAIPHHILEAAHEQALASGWSGPETLRPWVGLCMEMSEVTDILNSPSPLNSAGRERLADLDTRIHQRSEALPLPLRIHDDRIAELPITAYGLHIQFSGLRIVLHRLMTKGANQDADSGYSSHLPSPENGYEIQQSRALTHESAVRIAKLVSTYQQICGIENVITIMLDNSYVAAAVLIAHLLRVLPNDTSQSTYNDLHWLRFLSDMLTQAQKHYPVTVRMRATLASFVENTSLAGTFGNFSNSGSSSADPGTAPGQGFAEGDTNFGNSAFSTGRRQDAEMFENYFGNTTDPVFQDMDLNNMMAWVLSPSVDRS